MEKFAGQQTVSILQLCGDINGRALLYQGGRKPKNTAPVDIIDLATAAITICDNVLSDDSQSELFHPAVKTFMELTRAKLRNIIERCEELKSILDSDTIQALTEAEGEQIHTISIDIQNAISEILKLNSGESTILRWNETASSPSEDLAQDGSKFSTPNPTLEEWHSNGETLLQCALQANATWIRDKIAGNDGWSKFSVIIVINGKLVDCSIASIKFSDDLIEQYAKKYGVVPFRFIFTPMEPDSPWA